MQHGLGSTRASTDASVKPSVFSTASSPVRSRTEMAMVLPVTSSSVKNTTLPMASMQELDVAHLLRRRTA